MVERGKDGLSRQERLDKVQVQPFRSMEDDFFHLFARVLENSSFIHYFNLNDTPSGIYWKSLFKDEPVIILLEIKLFDTKQAENSYLQSFSSGESNIQEITNHINDWNRRLGKSNSPVRSLLYPIQSLLKTEIRGSEGIQDKEADKQKFYLLLNYIRNLQKEYDIHFKKIEKESSVDPAIAVLIAFVKNYASIVGRFNDRWKKLPEFYIDKILHVSPLKLLPPSAWLALTPDEKVNNCLIPAQSSFIGGQQADDTAIVFRNKYETHISPIQLKKVLAFSLDEKLWQKELSDYIEPENRTTLEATPLFHNKNGMQPVSTGILLESSMLLLKEGKRTVAISFTLTADNKPEYEKYLNTPECLNQAFLSDISTDEGWSHVEDLQLTYNKTSGQLNFDFTIPDTFPPSVACQYELHGIDSRMPVLQLTMNPDAAYYPYQWAMKCLFDNIKISVSVTGIKSAEIKNTLGESDASFAFYPFGPLPEQGSRMVWSNDEISQKTVKEVTFSCNWLQLPASGQGFYDIYKTYTPPLDNSSFKVRQEYSCNKEWVQETNDCPLFSYSFPKGKVSNKSTFTWKTDEDTSFDGVFRLTLTEPEIGFGFAAYRKLFADCMIHNSSNKKKINPPEAPVTPLMDQIEISYTAEDEIHFGTKGDATNIQVYYYHPLVDNCIKRVDSNKPASLFDGVSNKWNLLFGLSEATGENKIRLFADIAPIQRTVRDAGLDIVWFIKKNEWNWQKLPPETVRTDTTRHFMKAGLIELDLQEPLSEQGKDKNGLHWICAAFKDSKQEKPIIPAVSGFYLNCIEVVLDTDQPGFDEAQLPATFPAGTIQSTEKNIPGMASIRQITPAEGGYPKETTGEMKARVSNRIRHRNRAVTMKDYQELVLENFHEAGKVLCYSNHSKEQQSPSVSLVVTPVEYAPGSFPLCTYSLLCDIEDFIQKRTSPFVQVYASNPFYEEITVQCQIELLPSETPVGVLIQAAKDRINRCIAPWISKHEQPAFNYSFRLNDLKYEIGNCDSIQSVSNLVVLQRVADDMYRYHLNTYTENEGPELVKPTRPGTILFPGKNHIIRFTDPEPPLPEVGIGRLEIGNTFIIH